MERDYQVLRPVFNPLKRAVTFGNQNDILRKKTDLFKHCIQTKKVLSNQWN